MAPGPSSTDEQVVDHFQQFRLCPPQQPDDFFQEICLIHLTRSFRLLYDNVYSRLFMSEYRWRADRAAKLRNPPPPTLWMV